MESFKKREITNIEEMDYVFKQKKTAEHLMD